MKVQKFSGTANGYLVTIGTKQFAMLLKYYDGNKTGPTVTGARMDWFYSLDYIPYAILDNTSNTWIVSENPKPANGGYRDQTVGMLLNNIEPDKKKRLSREEFLKVFRPLYKEALIEEAEQFTCK